MTGLRCRRAVRLGRSLLVLGVVLAVGCGTASPPLLRGALKTEASVNPDVRGRPSPVVVRIYELKAVTAFNAADFFTLFDREAEALGADLVGREEYLMRPGENRPYQRQLQPDTKFIGVAAAFRDLENARWKQVAPVPPKKEPSVNIDVDGTAITVAIK